MSQQCWRPPSPTAAGLPSGWRCRPAGPVWSSTSGCCWVLCAAVSLNPDLAAHASNAARDPPVTSLSASDALCEGTGGQEADRARCGRGVRWLWASPPVPCGRGFSGMEVTGLRGQRLTVLSHCEEDQSEGSMLSALLICEELDKALMSQAGHHEIKPLTRTWLWFGNTLTLWIAKGIRRGELPLCIMWELQ